MRAMFKKLLCVMLAAVSLSFAVPCVSHAAFSNTISLYEKGNASNIIYIKRPESLSASTSDRTYTISAVGEQGTKIRLYKYNPARGVCELIRGETSMGASGLYSVVVDLTGDSNVFVITGESYRGSQAVRIDIDKIKKSTVDRLKNVTVTIRNFW